MELDHIGIAVRSLVEATPRWAPILGAPEGPPEEVPGQSVRVAFLGGRGAPVELLEPTSPAAALARSIEARGEGLHHLAFRVPSVDAALRSVERAGGRLVDRTGRPGARGRTVGFAHPSSFGGVLVEFVEGP
jgi:methylmalonyl-CoA epimerase